MAWLFHEAIVFDNACIHSGTVDPAGQHFCNIVTAEQGLKGHPCSTGAVGIVTAEQGLKGHPCSTGTVSYCSNRGSKDTPASSTVLVHYMRLSYWFPKREFIRSSYVWKEGLITFNT